MSKKSLENMMNKFDFDGSGSLNPEEFQEALTSLKINLSDMEIKKMMI